MKKLLALLVSLWLSPAYAGVSCSVPFNLTNGTTADASQVMANYNAILTCLSGSTAASGANSDITSLLGLTTPISAAQGGTVTYVGGTSVGTNTVTLANPVPNGFSYTAGNQIIFLAGGTNTSAVTLNVNSLGAKAVVKQTSTGTTALTGNEMVSGQLVVATYDGTAFEIAPLVSAVAGFGIAVSGNTISFNTTNPAVGFTPCTNLQLNVTVATNNLSVAIKGNNGSDPSATNPVMCAFHDTTETSGDPVWVTTTAATSFAANSGSSFGSTNAVPARFWIVGFNNAGTLAIGVVNASTATQVFPINEGVLTSTTACNACGTATVAGTFYTTAALSSKAFRILGYFEATEATAGTWASAPTRIKLFGPGTPKPGVSVQKVYVSTASTTSCNSGTISVETAVNGSITPTNNVNLVQITAQMASSTVGGASTTPNKYQISRGTSPTLIGQPASWGGTNLGTQQGMATLLVLDAPATASATTYAVYCSEAGGAFTQNGGTILIEEIMGALEPANDNHPLSATG